jgi:8-oxo-dGTP diphosphatase
MTDPAPDVPPTILAAGGVLWRPAARGPAGSPADGPGLDGIEVAVVHRPRYGDWSLPKGKLHPGEPTLLGACREVREETGFTPVLGRRLRSVAYLTTDGPKTVRYWAMRAGRGTFTASREVDALDWLPPAEAARRVSYQRDTEVLDDATAVRTDNLVLLVRHGRAGDRACWTGDDWLRPLDRVGRRQAEQLRRVLRWFGPRQVWSADRTRCVQTVSPLADDLDLPVRLDPALSEEGYEECPDAGLRRIRELARSGLPAAVCSQGGAIPDLVTVLAEDSGLRLCDVRAKKGSVWALCFEGDRLVAADYYADPAQ